MTLVVALVARDGVALVSDGQATTDDPIAKTRSRAEDKLFTLHGRIGYGCAGSVGLQQRVVESLEAGITKEDCDLPVSELRPKLRGVVNALQQEAVGEHVELPGSEDSEPAGLDLLFAGMSGDGDPWVYGIGPDGKEEVHPHGEAIGHARHFIFYLMASTVHYSLRDRGVEQVQVLAFRAVVDAVKTDSGGLGLPIHLVVVDGAGARQVRGDQLRAVEDTLNGWKQQEHDIFRGLPGEGESEGVDDAPQTGIAASDSA